MSDRHVSTWKGTRVCVQGAEPWKDSEGGQGGHHRASGQVPPLTGEMEALASPRGACMGWDPTSRQRNSSHPHTSPPFF